MKPLKQVVLGILMICGISVAAIAAKPTLTPELIAKGKIAFTQTCQTCHGDNGDGMGPTGKYMNPKPRNFADSKGYKNGNSVENIFETMSNGLKGTAMTAYSYLSEDDRWAIAYYVSDFQKTSKTAQKKKK